MKDTGEMGSRNETLEWPAFAGRTDLYTYVLALCLQNVMSLLSNINSINS